MAILKEQQSCETKLVVTEEAAGCFHTCSSSSRGRFHYNNQQHKGMVVAGGAAGGGGGSGAMHQVKAILPPSVFGSNAYAKNKNACATALARSDGDPISFITATINAYNHPILQNPTTTLPT